jgi:hypothetical protein
VRISDYPPPVAPKETISSSLEAEATLPPEGFLGSNSSTIEINPLEAVPDWDAELWEESSSLLTLSMLANLTFIVLPFAVGVAMGR